MSIPAPSFEQAMEITAQWLNLWDAGELSDEVLADRIGELVASRDDLSAALASAENGSNLEG